VAPLEDGPDVEAEAVVGPGRQRLEVGVREVRVEVDGPLNRRVLEERVVEMPGPQLAGRAAEAVRERAVDLLLPGLETGSGLPVDLVEHGEESGLVHLAGAEREREVVAVADRAADLVAQASKLPHLARHLGPDLLRRLPGPPAQLGVVAGPEDLEDRVVVDPLAVELAAEGVVGRLDRGLE